MKNNRKVLYGLVALALLLSVAGISIGFAAMQQQLDIEGVAEVVPANWDIKFKELSAPTITGGAVVTTAPTITGDTHLGDYDIQLTQPGDSVTYTFKVANEGSIDAKLGTFTKAVPTFTGTGATASADETIVSNNLVYELVYLDGTTETPVSVNDVLNHGTEKTLKLTVAYDKDAEDLPTAKVEIGGMDVTFIYVQK